MRIYYPDNPVMRAGGSTAISAPSAPVVPPPSGDITTDLVAKYLLADTSDATGRGNTLTNNGAVSFSSGAAVFDGTNYLSKVSSADVQADGDMTILARVKFNTVGAAGIVSKGSDGAGEYWLYYDDGTVSDLQWTFQLPGLSAPAAIPATPSTGVWYFLAATYTAGGAITLQLDEGTPVSDGGASTVTPDSTAFRIGSDDGNVNFNGEISGVRIFKRVLSAEDITAAKGDMEGE